MVDDNWKRRCKQELWEEWPNILLSVCGIAAILCIVVASR
jgi:hypothetical protein